MRKEIEMNFAIEYWRSWLWAALGLAGAVAIALLVHYLLFRLAKRLVRGSAVGIDASLVRHSERPTRWIFPLVAILLALPLLPLPQEIVARIQHALGLGVIASLAWTVILLADVFSDAISAKYEINVADNLAARRIRTQTQVLRRIFVIVVMVFALGIMLMTFPPIRTLGTSLLASAGLAGLVLGMAMRSTLSNVIAGIQIALTQPIRIDDVVIVEGEWGWIEEILSTYVVVRIWDLRRLVVPLSYFIEKPFQNWTRATADLLGTVFLYVDYTVSVEDVRQQLHRVLQSSGMWDGKTWGLQVTNASEHTLELRALMSAPNGSAAWDLRCYVREKLIGFLQQQYPQTLPRVRTEVRLERAV
jgi:small-conductance mechanosensitive channel